MKRKILLPLVLLAGMTLVGCGDNNGGGDTGDYGVEIANKATLQGDWVVGASKSLTINLTPAANALVALSEGTLTITSSNTSVVSVSGLGLSALEAGTSTITAKYHGATDFVDVTITAAAVVNYGTAESPLTVSQALTEVAKLELANKGYSPEQFFVKAKLKSTITGSGSYKFTLTDDTKDMDVSSAQIEAGKTTADYHIGDIVTVRAYCRKDDSKTNGYYLSYNNGGISGQEAPQIIAYEEGEGGEEVPEPAVVNTDLAGFLADTSGNGAKAFHFSAQVKSLNNDEYGNMYLKDGSGNEVQVYGSTATASALAWNGANAYTFVNPRDYLTNATTNAIRVGDTLEVKFIRCDYNTTKEGCGIILSVDAAPVVDATDFTMTPNADFEIEQGKSQSFAATLSPEGSVGTVNWTVESVEGSDLADATFANNKLTIAAGADVGAKYRVVGTLADSDPAVTHSVVATVIASEGGGGSSAVTLTAQSLLGYDGSADVAYDKSYKNSTVDGVAFTYQQIGAYKGGNYYGMQFRNKLNDASNGTKSNLNNTAALSSAISSIDFTWNANKQVYAGTNVLKITFDTVSSFDGANKEVINFNTIADQKEYTVTPVGSGFTFIKIEIGDAYTYSNYWESIVINL